MYRKKLVHFCLNGELKFTSKTRLDFILQIKKKNIIKKEKILAYKPACYRMPTHGRPRGWARVGSAKKKKFFLYYGGLFAAFLHIWGPFCYVFSHYGGGVGDLFHHVGAFFLHVWDPFLTCAPPPLRKFDRAYYT